MLVLSRKRDEQVVIGENGEVTVTVIDIRGEKVRLGFDAPAMIPVNRMEVYLAIKRDGYRRKEFDAEGADDSGTPNQEHQDE